jgi:hypothetical protein
MSSFTPPAPSAPVPAELSQRYTGIQADNTLTFKKRQDQLDKYRRQKQLKDAKNALFRTRFVLVIVISLFIFAAVKISSR